jgi:GNAT superfamily N-acetyltransferase
LRANDLIPRPMQAADAEAVAALVRLAFAAQSVPTDPPASALRLRPDDVLDHLAVGAGAVVAAAGTLVGSVMWAEQEGGLYIARLSVHPAWRGRGIARALLAAAEQAAGACNLPRLHLATRLVLDDNRRLFAACGFSEIARTAHPGYAHPTSVTLEKRLVAPGMEAPPA